MKITLCGSLRFEKELKEAEKKLSLAGHIVYSMSVWPSDQGGEKDWYTEKQKETLDWVHFEKIRNSEAIYVVAPGGYVGESTQREIDLALELGMEVMCPYPLSIRHELVRRTCPYAGCDNLVKTPPCVICYE